MTDIFTWRHAHLQDFSPWRFLVERVCVLWGNYELFK